MGKPLNLFIKTGEWGNLFRPFSKTGEWGRGNKFTFFPYTGDIFAKNIERQQFIKNIYKIG
jgi:hypothetical protein